MQRCSKHNDDMICGLINQTSESVPNGSGVIISGGSTEQVIQIDGLMRLEKFKVLCLVFTENQEKIEHLLTIYFIWLRVFLGTVRNLKRSLQRVYGPSALHISNIIIIIHDNPYSSAHDNPYSMLPPHVALICINHI